MTYGTPHTLLRRPQPMGPMPEAPPKVPLDEAVYAAKMRALMVKEGRRGIMPAAPSDRTLTLREKLLRTMRRLGPALPSVICDPLDLARADAAHEIDALIAEGLVEVIPAPLKHKPWRHLLALTHAGRAKAEAAR